MIFKFRLLSDEVDDFQLDIEVPYDINLLDLHNFIRRVLHYNPCEMASFFISDVEWEKFREFTLVDMGIDVPYDPDEDEDELAPPVPMEKVTAANVMHQKFDRLIYVFDMFAERQLFIELLESKKADPAQNYPLVVEQLGEAPKQFLDE